VVGHELADQPALCQERNERERADAFALDGRPEIAGKLGSIDVRDANDVGIAGIARPGRMSLDRAPVAVGQSPPGDEAHHVGIVEQQDRGALAAQRLADGVEGGLVDLVQRGGAEQSVGEEIQRRLLVPMLG
jgi:hypothetical protein